MKKERVCSTNCVKNYKFDTVKDHEIKDIANLFLSAMNDWKKTGTTYISEFIIDLKEYFGTPLTIEKIALI